MTLLNKKFGVGCLIILSAYTFIATSSIAIVLIMVTLDIIVVVVMYPLVS
mgnify:CR=1 FL=1